MTRSPDCSLVCQDSSSMQGLEWEQRREPTLQHLSFENCTGCKCNKRLNANSVSCCTGVRRIHPPLPNTFRTWLKATSQQDPSVLPPKNLWGILLVEVLVLVTAKSALWDPDSGMAFQYRSAQLIDTSRDAENPVSECLRNLHDTSGNSFRKTALYEISCLFIFCFKNKLCFCRTADNVSNCSNLKKMEYILYDQGICNSSWQGMTHTSLKRTKPKNPNGHTMGLVSSCLSLTASVTIWYQCQDTHLSTSRSSCYVIHHLLMMIFICRTLTNSTDCAVMNALCVHYHSFSEEGKVGENEERSLG